MARRTASTRAIDGVIAAALLKSGRFVPADDTKATISVVALADALVRIARESVAGKRVPQRLRFAGCTFDCRGGERFARLHLPVSLSFENCTFRNTSELLEPRLTIEDVYLEGLECNAVLFGVRLEFAGLRLQKQLSLRHCEFTSGLRLDDAQIDGDVLV